MKVQAATGDLGRRVPEHSFTEVGQIGLHYNRVIDALAGSQADLNRLASLDPLTGVLNRRGLYETLRSYGSQKISVVMFDVVNFRAINNTLGHSIGDEVLTRIATGLGQRLGPAWVFGRWGGDEFLAIACPATAIDPEVANEVACRLPSGGAIAIALRVAALRSALDLEPDEIISRINFALDEAKRIDNKFVYFENELADRYSHLVEVASSVDKSLPRSRLVAVAQTIHQDDQVVGAELLARWRNDDGNLAPPSSFLPAIRDTGLMYELDLHMLSKGIAFAARMKDLQRAPWVAVNVSPSSLAVVEFVPNVEYLLTKHQLPAHHLVLEVTETDQVVSQQQWLANCWQLRDLGVGLAIDDFGTGYSTIERLQTLPVTHLKFDRGLIQAVDGPMEGVVRSVVKYAQDSGITPIAEGVETEAQRRTVRSLGIELIQGYLFSRPQELGQVEDTILNTAADGQRKQTTFRRPESS